MIKKYGMRSLFKNIIYIKKSKGNSIMSKQNIYTAKKGWVAHTPYKGKKNGFFAPIGDLFNEEKGGHLIPQSDIESPNKVLKKFWPDFNIKNVKPFSDIKTGANIWEYYLLRMHGCEPSIYKKLRGKPSKTFGNLRKDRLGFTYSVWQDRYNEINSKILKNTSCEFINALKKRSNALRYNDSDKDYIKKRQKAAKAFFNYLACGKKTIVNDLSKKTDDPTLYDILEIMLKKEKNKKRKEHLYCIGLMLCLYGRKDEARVSPTLAEKVFKRISSIKNSLAHEVCSALKKTSSNFTKEFKPPYAGIYGYYQDKAIILFRLTTWLTLVEATYKACEEA